MFTSSALAAFEVTAGIKAYDLSFFIRTIMCVLFLLWAVWNLYGQLQLVNNRHLDVVDLPSVILRILFLCSMIVILIFIR